MRILGALLVFMSLGLVACGGGSKPAATEPAPSGSSDGSLDDVGDSDMPVENEQCCCDHVADPSEDPDDMTEQHSYEYMSMGACDEAAGVCTDDASCAE